MDEEKFDELRQEFELLKEYHGKLLEAFQLLRKKTDLHTLMIENINENQEEKWKKYDDLIQQFISSHDQSLEDLQKAVEEFLEDE
tara:strand:- start:513 stop:767 length:255 start_codon:yes stop_codon:yes gene_type:complete